MIWSELKKIKIIWLFAKTGKFRVTFKRQLCNSVQPFVFVEYCCCCCYDRLLLLTRHTRGYTTRSCGRGRPYWFPDPRKDRRVGGRYGVVKAEKRIVPGSGGGHEGVWAGTQSEGAAAFVAYSGRIVSRTRPVPCARCIRRRLNYACVSFLGGKVYPGLYGGVGGGGGGGRERVARATFVGRRWRLPPRACFFLAAWGLAESPTARTCVTATGWPFVFGCQTYLLNDVRDNGVFFYLPVTSETIRMSRTRTNKTKRYKAF